MPELSLVIITKNEEKHIGECIRSALNIVDDIVVLDEFSTDRTKEIILKNGGRYFSENFRGFGKQKQLAVSLAKHDWVLCLDADERVSEELEQSILEWKKNPRSEIFGYSFNRLSYYCGKAIKTCGWYPVNRIRLFHRLHGNWNDMDVHEIVEMQTGKKEGFLQGDMLHYTMKTVEEHIEKVKKYARIKSDSLKDKNTFYLLFKSIFNPISVFIKMFFFKKGFMDGWHGFTLSRVSALSEVWIYKYALQKKAGIN